VACKRVCICVCGGTYKNTKSKNVYTQRMLNTLKKILGNLSLYNLIENRRYLLTLIMSKAANWFQETL